MCSYQVTKSVLPLHALQHTHATCRAGPNHHSQTNKQDDMFRSGETGFKSLHGLQGLEHVTPPHLCDLSLMGMKNQSAWAGSAVRAPLLSRRWVNRMCRGRSMRRVLPLRR
jgi:hypothetical protein